MTAESDRERDDRLEYRDTVKRIFEMLNSNSKSIVRLETKSDIMAAELKSLNTTVAGMESNGCAVGKQQSEAIKELKDRPAKFLAAAVAISTLFSFLLSFIWRHEVK